MFMKMFKKFATPPVEIRNINYLLYEELRSVRVLPFSKNTAWRNDISMIDLSGDYDLHDIKNIPEDLKKVFIRGILREKVKAMENLALKSFQAADCVHTITIESLRKIPCIGISSSMKKIVKSLAEPYLNDLRRDYIMLMGADLKRLLEVAGIYMDMGDYLVKGDLLYRGESGALMVGKQTFIRCILVPSMSRKSGIIFGDSPIERTDESSYRIIHEKLRIKLKIGFSNTNCKIAKLV